MHHRPRTYYGKKLVKRGLYEKKDRKSIKKTVQSMIKSKRPKRRVRHREFRNIKRVKQKININNRYK